MLIKHILFPVDFSPRCCAAAPFVKAMASRFGATVALISVAPPYSYTAMGDPGGPVMIDTDELLRDLRERLDSAFVREFAGLEVDRIPEVGEPAETIAAFAKHNNIDLIMMPTHGYGSFRSMLLGSVTAKVLHDTECPVWTAAHVEDPPIAEHVATRAILCAVDGTEKSIELIAYAARLACDYGASLRLVHVIPGFHPGARDEAGQEFEDYMRAEGRKTIEALQKQVGVEAPLCVAMGEIAEGVREEARRHGADLVVIGRGVLHEKLGRLRTHTYGIVRRSPCPVLSV